MEQDEPKGTQDGMFFSEYIFAPEHKVELEELVELIAHIGIRCPTDQFEQLSPQLKKHFVERKRDGTVERYRPQSRFSKR